MTGEELYQLLQSHAPGVFWTRWDALTGEVQQAMNKTAETIRERHAEDLREAMAGEDA